MARILRATVVGPRDREAALVAFWEYQRRYMGGRRKDPAGIVKVRQVRHCPYPFGSGFSVVTVPVLSRNSGESSVSSFMGGGSWVAGAWTLI